MLTELYQQMKAKAVQCDLAGLWNKLGVEPFGGVSFDDRAPLAAVRRAITAIPAGTTSGYPACRWAGTSPPTCTLFALHPRRMPQT